MWCRPPPPCRGTAPPSRLSPRNSKRNLIRRNSHHSNNNSSFRTRHSNSNHSDSIHTTCSTCHLPRNHLCQLTLPPHFSKDLMALWHRSRCSRERHTRIPLRWPHKAIELFPNQLCSPLKACTISSFSGRDSPSYVEETHLAFAFSLNVLRSKVTSASCSCVFTNALFFFLAAEIVQFLFFFCS